jgi:hypothetical protein
MGLGGLAALGNQRRWKMTKLRKMAGIAFVAMGLLTGLAVKNAHAFDICQVEPAFCQHVVEDADAP